MCGVAGCKSAADGEPLSWHHGAPSPLAWDGSFSWLRVAVAGDCRHRHRHRALCCFRRLDPSVGGHHLGGASAGAPAGQNDDSN